MEKNRLSTAQNVNPLMYVLRTDNLLLLYLTVHKMKSFSITLVKNKRGNGLIYKVQSSRGTFYVDVINAEANPPINFIVRLVEIEGDLQQIITLVFDESIKTKIVKKDGQKNLVFYSANKNSSPPVTSKSAISILG